MAVAGCQTAVVVTTPNGAGRARVVTVPGAKSPALAVKGNGNPAPPPPQALALSVPASYPAFQGQAYDSGDNADVGCCSGTPGAALVYITGGTGPYTCTVTSGAVPAGMTLAAATPSIYPSGVCEISGTPTVDGDFPLTIQASDSAGHSGSANATFVVMSSALPQITNLGATAVSPTSETVTWTTNVPASSIVCYALGNEMNVCTPEADLGGVTSHAVTLTGLLAGYGYDTFVESRGVAGGAPRDYLAVGTNEYSDDFTTEAPPATGTADMIAYGSGPVAIVQGFPLYVGIAYGPTVAPSSSNGARFTITGLPPDTQVHWPDQQDNGLAQGTVSTTDTTNDTLTMSGLSAAGSTQFELLTNQGGTTPAGSYTLTVNYTVVGASGGSFSWPVTVNAPASFTPTPPGSQPTIPDLATWQARMINTGNVVPNETDWYNIQDRGGACDIPENSEGVAYYDGAWVYDQIGAYTGNTAYWITGGNTSPCPYVDSTTASLVDGVNQGVTAGSHVITPASMTGIAVGESLAIDPYNALEYVTVTAATSTTFTATFAGSHSAGFPVDVQNTAGPQGSTGVAALYRDYLVSANYNVQGFWDFPHGLYYACKTLGKAQSCSDLHSLANGTDGDLTWDGRTNGTNIRETSYTLGLRRLDYDAGGSTSTLAQMHQLVDDLLGFIDTTTRGPNSGLQFYDQPFMDGLMAQALIEYYMDPNTGNQSDARIPLALEQLANYMWTYDWLPRGNGQAGMFIYNVLDTDHGQLSNGTGSDLRALNLLVAPLYAWLYSETGNVAYQQEGDVIWDSGVTTSVDNGLDWDGRIFVQEYRWSFEFAKWRGAAGTYVNPW